MYIYNVEKVPKIQILMLQLIDELSNQRLDVT